MSAQGIEPDQFINNDDTQQDVNGVRALSLAEGVNLRVKTNGAFAALEGDRSRIVPGVRVLRDEWRLCASNMVYLGIVRNRQYFVTENAHPVNDIDNLQKLFGCAVSSEDDVFGLRIPSIDEICMVVGMRGVRDVPAINKFLNDNTERQMYFSPDKDDDVAFIRSDYVANNRFLVWNRGFGLYSV